MDTMAWIVLAILIVVAIILVIAWATWRGRRLRSQFGPEYQRTVERSGSKWRAESELAARQHRRQKLDIRPLPAESKDHYASVWRDAQNRFVDQPHEAVASAEELVQTVMRQRGYPTDNFEQHANDLSVDYPDLVENYRGAHAIATRERSANTEDLRKAMLHYRALFTELLGDQQVARGKRAEFERDGQGAGARAETAKPATVEERQR